MTQDRSALRTTAAIERRPAVAATIQRSAAPATSPARAIQQRLGHQATQALIARSIVATTAESTARAPAPVSAGSPPPIQLAAEVSAPHEVAELEAEETARKVVRMPQPASSPPKTGKAEPGSVQREAVSAAPFPATTRVNISGGLPLPANVRAFMEPR